jgi:hypothetical protein
MGNSRYRKSLELRDWLIKKGATLVNTTKVWEVAAKRPDGWHVVLQGPMHTGSSRTNYRGFLREGNKPVTSAIASSIVSFVLPQDAKAWFIASALGKDGKAKTIEIGAHQYVQKDREKPAKAHL